MQFQNFPTVDLPKYGLASRFSAISHTATTFPPSLRLSLLNPSIGHFQAKMSNPKSVAENMLWGGRFTRE